MENASKALLIAGGVLIAMIIASFGVYLYGVYHSHAENVMNRLTESQITEFNAKFLAVEGRDLTANELISVINLVRENNTTKESNDYQITIKSGGWTLLGRYNFKYITTVQDETEYEKDCMTFLKENLDGKEVYGCTDFKYSEKTGLINSLTITHRMLNNP